MSRVTGCRIAHRGPGAREGRSHRYKLEGMRKPIPVSSHPVFTGRIINVSTERLRYPNGREYDLDFVRHPGAAAVVAVDGAGRVCVVRQYRHGIADFHCEIPAFKLYFGEAPQASAIREFSEETVVKAERFTSLGQY